MTAPLFKHRSIERHPQHFVRPAVGDVDRVIFIDIEAEWRKAAELPQVVSFLIENLNPVVLAISYIDEPFRIELDRVR